MRFNPYKHHRRSIRLKGYDYSQPGYYYITICSQNRECMFWKNNNDVNINVGAVLAPAPNKIQLSITGEVIEKQLHSIPNQFKNVRLDEYIIMPNHVHVIIVIKTRVEASTTPTIPQIIRSLKSRCINEYCQYIKMNNLNISGKLWQRNYYEHIIRDEDELNRIRKYMQENPYRWAEDEENPNNIVESFSC